MPNLPTDNSNGIWPKDTSDGGADRLLQALEDLAIDVAADPNVNPAEIAAQFDAAAKAGLPTISKLTDLPTISKLKADPVKWVVDRLLPYGCLTMLVGSQGSMKSMFAMYVAQAISGGHRDFLGRTIISDKEKHGVPVLYIDRENPEAEVSNRARYMGIWANANFTYWGDFNKDGQTPEIDDDRLLDWAHKHNLFFIIDSLQDWYGDENENDNSAMVKLLGKFRKLARAGAGVLLLHHKNAGGERARGGTSITNLTDMAIKAGKNVDDPNTIELREERFRMCGGWEIDVKAHWDAGEMHDSQKHYQLELLRDQLVSEVIKDKKAEQQEKAQAKNGKDKDDTVRILAMAREHGYAPSTLANKLSIRKERIIRLADQVGATWDGENWQGLDTNF